MYVRINMMYELGGMGASLYLSKGIEILAKSRVDVRNLQQRHSSIQATSRKSRPSRRLWSNTDWVN